MLAIEENRVDGTRRARLKLQRVTQTAQLRSHVFRRRRRDEHVARTRLVFAKRRSHLIAVDVRRLDRLLYRHPELDDVEKELQEILVLAVAALHRERQERLTILERETRSERHAWLFARRDHVDRTFARIRLEALLALAQTDSRSSCDHCRLPAGTRRHGHH